MKRLIHLPLATCFLVCVFVGAGLLAVGEGRRCIFGEVQPAPPMEGWDCRDVVNHLRSTGLDYQVVSTSENGPCAHSVFLTKTDKNWLELNQTAKSRERIDAWKDTVYCERLAEPWLRQEQIRQWGDCCLQIGSFVFFGDRDMLAEIESSLARPARG
jgi:hypothetical protein